MDRKFNGEMLTLARQLRRKSQADVVSALNGRITQGTLSKIEHGMTQPDQVLTEALASVLSVRPSFFSNPGYVRSLPVNYHRKRQKLSARDEGAIHGQSEVFRLNIRRLLESVEIEHRKPPVPFLDIDLYENDLEAVASAARQHWGLPRGPVSNVTKIIEDAGVVVIPFNFGTTLMDGFAQRATDNFPSVVFINTTQPTCRYRYSLSHELGHLAMHLTPNPDQEKQANRFASAFLMPKSEIKPYLKNLSLQKLQELKLYWGVSMQALIYRAWEVDAISDRAMKYFFVEMSKRGWREREPIEVNIPETATALRDIVAAHVEDLNYSIEEISELFGLEIDEAKALYPIPTSRPKLRLVVG
jgi:Zn-dependent peptidase ImmA (M78 family)/transcriptional regulator with XRE-family HTH domain